MNILWSPNRLKKKSFRLPATSWTDESREWWRKRIILDVDVDIDVQDSLDPAEGLNFLDNEAKES